MSTLSTKTKFCKTRITVKSSNNKQALCKQSNGFKSNKDAQQILSNYDGRAQRLLCNKTPARNKQADSEQQLRLKTRLMGTWFSNFLSITQKLAPNLDIVVHMLNQNPKLIAVVILMIEYIFKMPNKDIEIFRESIQKYFEICAILWYVLSIFD